MEGPQYMMPHTHQQGTVGNILCCLCGVPVPPNPANMCVNCLKTQVDITEGIPKEMILHFCKGCGRYLKLTSWVRAELESRELLALCLKKLKGLNKVKLVDASFIWTEPHSRRVKVKVTIQKEVFANTILQQAFVVEYVVEGKFCDDCHSVAAKDTWTAVAQVRQKVDHKKTFYYIEQLILKHNMHAKCVGIKELHDGIDFFFGARNECMKMVDFLQGIAPSRHKESKRLISADEQNATANFKFTLSVEIAPVCKEDLVCLPKKLAQHCGNISPVCVCYKITNMVGVIDPLTLQVADMLPDLYWKHNFRPLASSKAMKSFVVIDIELLGPTRGKYALADITVARSSDFGVNDRQYITRSHLGTFLQPGDEAWGYDMAALNMHIDAEMQLQGTDLPDVILVKKNFENVRKNKRKPRTWKLRHLAKESAEADSGDKKKGRKAKGNWEEKEAQEMEEFMQDLEEDSEMRQQVNMYKDNKAIEQLQQRKPSSEMADTDDDELPQVGLEELLEDLQIGGGSDEEDELPPSDDDLMED